MGFEVAVISNIAWRIVPAEFVTTDSGTGIVHQAPAFGEVDFDVLRSEQSRFKEGVGPELICAVGPDGKFTAEATDYKGRWVKDCDRDISRELRNAGCSGIKNNICTIIRSVGEPKKIR